MKKILWIIAVLVLFFAGDRVGGYLLKNLLEKSQFRYSRLYNKEAQADILLVGNSRGLIFYQPYIEEITGRSTFNISYNGLSMDLAEALVGDYLDRYPAPKTMVLDVTMCDRLNDPLLAGFGLYTPYSKRLSRLLKERSPKAAFGGRLSHLFRYNSELYQRALFYLNKNDEDWLLDRVINENMRNKIAEEPSYFIAKQKEEKGKDYVYFHDFDYLLNALDNTINLARQKGIEVKLVINPYYPPFADKIANLQEFKAKIESSTGLEVADYAKAIPNSKGFGDYQHLNKLGSKLYIDKLVEDKIFK